MSIYKIAEAADLSIATVSRYLNSGSVSKKSARKLEKVIKDGNFNIETLRPGPKTAERQGIHTGVVVLLSIGRLDVMGLLRQHTNVRMISSCIDILNQSGLNIMHMHIPDSRTIPKKLNMKYCDGTIIFGRDLKIHKDLKEHLMTLPAVWGFNHCIDSGFKDMDQIAYDNDKVSRLAVDYFAGHNHHRIAYVSNMRDNQVNNQRWMVFKGEAERAGMEAVILQADHAANYNEQAADIAGKAAGSGATGLSFSSDILMLATHNHLIYHGAGPDEYDILGCNNTNHLLQLCCKRPPSIDLHYEEIGATAAETLLRRMNSNNSKRPEHHLLAPCINYGMDE